jgi:Ca2+-binding EF-hand superfamily protein
VTHIITDRPDNIHEYLLSQLKKQLYYRTQKSLQEPSYFTNEDFEIMFETYDLIKQGYIRFDCLIQALGLVGVRNPIEAIREDFPEVSHDSRITRPKFVQVMMAEFTKWGFS